MGAPARPRLGGGIPSQLAGIAPGRIIERRASRASGAKACASLALADALLRPHPDALRQPGSGPRPGLPDAAPRLVAHRRLPAGRHARRAAHARLRGRCRPGGAARRDWRHPPDVRRRPPVPHRRAARRPVGGHPWGGRAERGRDRIRGGARASGRLGLVGGRDPRPGPGRRQHRGAGPRAVGQQRSPYPGRSHRRRLARRRGPVHRGRAGLAPGIRWARDDRHAAVDGPRSHRDQSVGAGGLHRRGRDPRHSPGARLRRRDAVARAVHAHGPRDRPRHRRRFLVDLQRVDGARGVSGRDGRWQVRLQPARGVRGAADARCLRRAVLRVGGHVAGSRRAHRVARPRARLPGHRARRQAAGRLPARVGAALPLPGGADGGRRAGADRGVFVHPRDHWPRSRRAHRRGDECAGRDIDRVDRARILPSTG